MQGRFYCISFIYKTLYYFCNFFYVVFCRKIIMRYFKFSSKKLFAILSLFVLSSFIICIKLDGNFNKTLIEV